MARIERRAASRQKLLLSVLPFTKINYQILAIGILCIVLGYIALAQEPWDGTMAIVIAPILLILGYCFLIPFGILFHKRSTESAEISQPTSTQVENSH
jgi:uncharacterized membrane protein HdeD (DUF308 family)